MRRLRVLCDIDIAPSVATSAIPPWLFPMPVVIFNYEEKHNKEKSILNKYSSAAIHRTNIL